MVGMRWRRVPFLVVLGVAVPGCTNNHGSESPSVSTSMTTASTISATLDVTVEVPASTSVGPEPSVSVGWERLPSGPWTGDTVGWTFSAMNAAVLAYGPDGWYVIEVEADEVRQTQPSPISPRSGAATAWTGTEFLIWGGSEQSSDAVETLQMSGAAYNPGSDTWRMLPAAPLDVDSPKAVAWDGHEMYVWDAVQGDQPAQLNDAAAYDPVADTWRPLGSRLPNANYEVVRSAEGTPPLLWLDQRDSTVPLYGTSNRLYSYDGNSDRWTPRDDSPLRGWSPAASVAGDTFTALGESRSPDAETVDLEAVTWTASGGWQNLPLPQLDTVPVCQTQVLAHGVDVVARRCTAVSVLHEGEWVRLERITDSARLLIAGTWLLSIDINRIDRLAINT